MGDNSVSWYDEFCIFSKSIYLFSIIFKFHGLSCAGGEDL
jgi:hypothetical protein